jgi:hypothetical protein
MYAQALAGRNALTHRGHMTIKKKVTPNVIGANRSNAKKSTGPRNTTTVKQNATRHGLLAKTLRFQDDNEKNEFDTLVRELEEEQQAAGQIERALIEEAALCLWKLRSANECEIQELANRREASKAMMKSLAESYDDEKLNLFNRWDGSASPALLGWACDELTVRSGTTTSEQEKENATDRNSKAGNVQIEAKLTTSLDTILRYEAAIKRDLYRAITALRDIRRDRCDEG